MSWTTDTFAKVIDILAAYPSIPEALPSIQEYLRDPSFSRHTLRRRFLQGAYKNPSAYLGELPEDLEDDDSPDTIDEGFLTRSVLDLLHKAALKKPAEVLDLEALCDHLSIAPKYVREAIEELKRQGHEISVNLGFVGLTRDDNPSIQTSDISRPLEGALQVVGVISDTHFGSKYCMRSAVRDFVLYAYDQGVRVILHPGDLLDGNYRHGALELSQRGLSDQTAEMAAILPHLPGLSYHFITGNHDETFWESSGVNVGRSIEADFKALGREDMHWYGDRRAFLKVQGATVELWHPRGSGGYAKSYKLQKHLGELGPQQPQICLVGHYHQFCITEVNGCYGILCPTFQGNGSKFSKSLGGNQAQGGLILSWNLGEAGELLNFSATKRSYYEEETVQRITPGFKIGANDHLDLPRF